jgi:hypothetical protein
MVEDGTVQELPVAGTATHRTAMDPQPENSELDRFRALVLSDDCLQEDLYAYDDIAAFCARGSNLAAEKGFALTAGALQSSLQEDLIGLSRWSAIPLRTVPPEKNWLPIHIAWFDGQPCIEWAYFGAQRLTESFFEDSLRIALMHPLNRLVKCRTLLADLPAWTMQHPGLEPGGFIFHMSRCGSTLVSQMLASDPHNVVVSEANPIDKTLQIDHARSTAGAHPAQLTAMIGALGRKRADTQHRYFIKLDSWHTRALPLFRRAFPSVPWIFLYREPIEVLTSQMLQPGIHRVPDSIQLAWFGLDPEDSVPDERYCARALASICEAVLQPYAEGGGLLVNYTDLPQALWTRIMPHFGIACSDAVREAMAATARYDAKAPGMEFSRNASDLRQRKTEELRPIAEQYLGDVYRQLESLRQAARHAHETADIEHGK